MHYDSNQHSALIHRIIDIIQSDEELSEAFDDFTQKHFAIPEIIHTEQTENMSFNSFLYEYCIDDQTVLAFIADQFADEFSEEELAYLHTIDDNIYGLFEILSIESGKRMTIRNVQTEKTYEILENKGTYGASAGDLLFCRITSVNDVSFILYSDGRYPLEAGYSLKRNLAGLEIPLSTTLVAGVFYRDQAQYDEEGRLVNPEKRLKRFLKKIFGKKFEFSVIKNRLLERPSDEIAETIQGVVRDYGADMNSNESLQFQDLLFEYSNLLFKGKQAELGMIEEVIMKQLFVEMYQEMQKRYETHETPPKEEIDEFVNQWIGTPQKELGGRTPKELVESERSSRDNHEPFQPDINISVQKAYDPLQAKFEKAHQLAKDEQYEKALDLYLAVLEEKTDFPPLLHNIGSCHAGLYHRTQDMKHLKTAKKYYEKALKADPDYTLAKEKAAECEFLLTLRKVVHWGQKKKKGKHSRSLYQLKITLKDTKPPVWRRLLIPGSATFWELHVALQDAMGWMDSHLHEFWCKDQFLFSGARIGLKDSDFPDPDVLPERTEKLCDWLHSEKDWINYTYDFGDNWDHRIELEKILPIESNGEYPRCIKGKRTCPPEDCGGVWGYERICAGKHEFQEDFDDFFDPMEPFDPDIIEFSDPELVWKDRQQQI